MADLTVKVTDFPFCAAGDGVTDDRGAIQSAIDYVFSKGGGTVLLDEGREFLSAALVLRSNVTLLFGDGAVLHQSPHREDYVKPAADGYEPYLPVYGQNFSDKIKWSHNWYHNYPMLFAPEGSENFAVRGKGTLRMMEVTDEDKVIKICPVGFYRCRNFEISDIHITNYHGYAAMPFTCENGIFKNLIIDNWSCGNGDGICLMNGRNIRVTGCKMFTGDDSVYIFSSYRDPRRGEWWNSDDPQPSENIEIDHNDLVSNHCKAFGMILWGIECPDLEKVEVRNVYVHDNHFETMGNWLWNPYSDKGIDPPVTSVRFENNVIDGIEKNFFETKISDMNYFSSMKELKNGNFDDGRCWWAMKKNSDDNSVKVIRKNGDECGYGYIGSYGKGDCRLYQGLFIRNDVKCFYRAVISGTGRIFVRSKDRDGLIASLDFEGADRELLELPFTVPENGNYIIGIEKGGNDDGFAEIRDARFASFDAPECDSIIVDRGKVIYKYNDNLFRRDS